MIKALLGQDAPEVLAYPLEAVIAEKFEAIVSRGMITSRMKDFFDLYTLASFRQFDRKALLHSIESTFLRRGTPMPTKLPTILSDALLQDTIKQTQWAGFVRRIEHKPSELPLTSVLRRVQEFLGFVWNPESMADSSEWTPEKGWR